VKDRRPGHPVRLTQPELVCLAVAQVLLGFGSEHRWIRFALCHLRGCFPYLPHQPGYNKRLRAALPLVRQVIRDLAIDSDFWFDNVWIADSAAVVFRDCARLPGGRGRPSRDTRADAGGQVPRRREPEHRVHRRCPGVGQPRLGAGLEQRAGDLAAVMRTVLDAGLTEVSTPGHPRHFLAPGGQVFTITQGS
jgi:hypothetical protein